MLLCDTIVSAGKHLSNTNRFFRIAPAQDNGVTQSFTFGFTTRCLQNATEEKYRNKAIQACLLSCNSFTVFSANIYEIQPLSLFRKVSGDMCFRESNTQNPNKYWLIQKYFGLSND